MSNYFAVIVFITVTMMATNIIQLVENQTLCRRTKQKLIFIAVLTIIGVVCEFFGIRLNEFPDGSRYAHAIIRAIELSIAPLIPIEYVRIVENRNLEKREKVLMSSLCFINASCVWISLFTPVVFFIDLNNIYHHGRYYLVFCVINALEIFIFIVALLKHTKRYQSRNFASLISMIIFLISGLAVSLSDNSICSTWLIVAITLLLFIMYYSDISLKVDALTSLFNRKSYENQLKKLDYTTAIIVLDANDFKQINDTYGHQIGDNMLKIIAKTLLSSYRKYGYCYRIGGDEFCVILKPNMIDQFIKENPKRNVSIKIDEINKSFDNQLKKKCEEYPMLSAGVSKGYAIFAGLYDVESNSIENNHYSLTSVKETVKLADERMYEDKKRCKETNNSVIK